MFISLSFTFGPDFTLEVCCFYCTNKSILPKIGEDTKSHAQGLNTKSECWVWLSHLPKPLCHGALCLAWTNSKNQGRHLWYKLNSCKFTHTYNLKLIGKLWSTSIKYQLNRVKRIRTWQGLNNGHPISTQELFHCTAWVCKTFLSV